MTLMCLRTCLHRDSAPVILPCSFRGGEKTSRSFSITPSPPFALTLISRAGGGWWQAIHPALSSEHTCVGACASFLPLPSVILFPPPSLLLLFFLPLVLQPFHRSSRRFNCFGPDHFTPRLFVLLGPSFPPPHHITHTHSPKEAK